MKTTLIAVMLCLSSLLLCACSADVAHTKSQDAASSIAAPALEGDLVEADKFTVIAASGWDKMDIQGGVQIYKGSLIFQMTISGNNVTPEEDLSLLESLKDQYEGSDIEQVELLGLGFYRMDYTASGVEQAFYSAVNNGEQIHIQLGGSGFADDNDIAAMLASIKLK